ncbi:oxidoreductase-like protein [Xylaria scruposa]|nr:oxidoreductase-like protein [Xylaria scruposa]
MPPNMRPLMRVARIQSVSRSLQIQRAFASGGPLPGGTPGESSVQAMPIGPYYESILTKPQPIPKTKPEEPPVSSPKSPRSSTKRAQKAKEDASASSGTTTSSSTATTITNTVPPQPTSEPNTAQEKARIIFGSRLAGPAERADRLQSIRDRSVRVAGVLVPPRPDEPDNCCMSGCVNCVWDRYRDDLEDWASASARAEEAALQQAAERRAREEEVVDVDAVAGEASVSTALSSVDDDGGGSETNWRAEEEEEEMAKKKTHRPKIAKDLWDDDLYSNIPVGIREFMKHEKKLKKKHEEEGTFGA